MKLIKLTQGRFAKVDDDKYDWLMQWNWHFDNGYAVRKEKGKHILLHRVLMNAQPGQMVDHISGDTVDNQMENLRLCDHSKNAMNMKKQLNKSSIYKGVSRDVYGWRTVLWKDNEVIMRTYVSGLTEQEERWAAMIYDLNGAALYGEYARLNFPEAILSVQE